MGVFYSIYTDCYFARMGDFFAFFRTPLSVLHTLCVSVLQKSYSYASISLMLTIRLQRTGRNNEPFFRVILTDSKNAAKTGKFLDILGFYNPKSGEIVMKTDEIKRRMSQGVKVSDTVHNFLVSQKVIEGKKINVLSKKSPTKKRKEAKS